MKELTQLLRGLPRIMRALLVFVCKLVVSLPTLYRAGKIMLARDKWIKSLEAERVDRLRNPGRYR